MHLHGMWVLVLGWCHETLKKLGNVLFYFYSCVWVVCLCACLCAVYMPSAHRSQKRALDSLKLELETAVSCLIWVLGITLGSSGRAVCALNCCAISLSTKNICKQKNLIILKVDSGTFAQVGYGTWKEEETWGQFQGVVWASTGVKCGQYYTGPPLYGQTYRTAHA